MHKLNLIQILFVNSDNITLKVSSTSGCLKICSVESWILNKPQEMELIEWFEILKIWKVQGSNIGIPVWWYMADKNLRHSMLHFGFKLQGLISSIIQQSLTHL